VAPLTYVGGFETNSPTITPLRAGQVLKIVFGSFTPRIIVHSERELTVEIIAGDNAGFSDTVEYEAVVVRDALVVSHGRNTLEAPSCTCSILLPARHTQR